MRRTRNVKRDPAVKVGSGRSGNDRAAIALVEHTCKENRATCEVVIAPKDVTSATCGRCVQKMVGGAALPPEKKKEVVA